MPRKAADPSKKKSLQLGVTLTPGSRYMLDQLVSQRLLGDGYSEVLRQVVLAGLKVLKDEYGLNYLHTDHPAPQPSAPALPTPPGPKAPDDG